MLTRLRISGFKNLVDVDIHFGPFTCIAGANGVGKSNLFDAIQFLSLLADKRFIDAAMSVRDEGGKTSDVRSLFHRVGDDYDDRMTFEVELIIPSEGIDDLGQKAKASITFVKYKIVLEYEMNEDLPSPESIKLIHEELVHLKLGDASKRLRFPPKGNTWRKSVIKGRRTSPFISTDENDDGTRIIKLSQDGNQGRPKSFLAENLPRTVLSSVNATESPTAFLTRKEMKSWRLLQLEPSSLRQPDEFITSPGIGADGSHLAATLYYLARTQNGKDHSQKKGHSWVYDQVAARLSELIEDVRGVKIDRDERRQLLTLEIKDREGTVHPARSLSDGTLRFLALAVLDLDPKANGLVCMEEPENGIHPERIPAILRLLQDIATDTEEPIGFDNPLRQVIINTHSPVVVGQVPDDSLLVAKLTEMKHSQTRFKAVQFCALPDTWRDEFNSVCIIDRGRLLIYLNPTTETSDVNYKRVKDRDDLQMPLPFHDLE